MTSHSYEAVIGLEIHVQLKTKSKMFCPCDNAPDATQPNSAVCPVCMGHPGTLPVANRQAIRWAVRAALALGCRINPVSKFDRKNYFYPDMPKGYQISQFDQPIGVNGLVHFPTPDGDSEVRITRLHLEDDAAKLLHPEGADASLVDFNRAGTPLIEVVTEPDFRSPSDVRAFLHELRLIIRVLGISDADMEKGQLRCDPNISLRPMGEARLYPKTEVKNLNSFRAIERALIYEIKRQTEAWNNGVAPSMQATRGWNDVAGSTVKQRTKEDAADYRYFPEPDLPALTFDRETINRAKAELPELPRNRRIRFAQQWYLPEKDVNVLVENDDLGKYAEDVLSEIGAWYRTEYPEDWEKRYENDASALAQLTANWLINKFVPVLEAKEKTVDDSPVTAENFGELMKILFRKEINASMAQSVLEEMTETGGDPSDIIDAKGLTQVTDEGEIAAIVDTIIDDNPGPVQEYRSGKQATLQFLVGQVMKTSKGKADPQIAAQLLKTKLSG